MRLIHHFFETLGDQKSFRRSIPRRFGFAFDDTLKVPFERLDNLRKSSPVKSFDNEGTIWFEVHERKLKG
jgi:hypothetical protein